jgi:hypothetical protein
MHLVAGDLRANDIEVLVMWHLNEEEEVGSVKSGKRSSEHKTCDKYSDSR